MGDILTKALSEKSDYQSGTPPGPVHWAIDGSDLGLPRSPW